MALKKTKNPAKSISPKQFTAQTKSLIRGLDNEVARVQKGMVAIQGIRSRLTSLTAGLANVTVSAAKPVATKPVVKASKPAPKKPAAKKPAKVKSAKSAKPVKATKPSKPATIKKAEPKEAKSEAVVEKTPVVGRPVLGAALKELLVESGVPVKPGDLRKRVVKKYGYWSRQSVYMIFKKKQEFKTIGSGDDARVGLAEWPDSKWVDSASSADEVESLVDKVSADRATASMV